MKYFVRYILCAINTVFWFSVLALLQWIYVYGPFWISHHEGVSDNGPSVFLVAAHLLTVVGLIGTSIFIIEVVDDK